MIYTYSTGMIFIDIVDLKNADVDDETAIIVWSATINGLLKDTSQGIASRIEKNVDQAFKQSWYLGTD